MSARPVRAVAILAASALVAGVALLPATADAASCRARISGKGTGQGVFGKGTENARAAATAEWEAKARSRHGGKFASLSKAGSVTWDCKSTALKATCVVAAKPCR